MRIAIVGAGAIGGYLGTRLAAAGEEVTFIARGANLEAIRERGMKLILEDGAEVRASGARAFENMREAGSQDAGSRVHGRMVAVGNGEKQPENKGRE